MEFGSFYSGVDGEYSGVSLAEIFDTLAMNSDISFRKVPQRFFLNYFL